MLESPELELLVIGVAAALGIYVAGTRMDFILEASKASGVTRKNLKRQIIALTPAVYGIFLICLAATLSALRFHWDAVYFVWMLFWELLYLLVLHVYNDWVHWARKPVPPPSLPVVPVRTRRGGRKGVKRS